MTGRNEKSRGLRLRKGKRMAENVYIRSERGEKGKYCAAVEWRKIQVEVNGFLSLSLS